MPACSTNWSVNQTLYLPAIPQFLTGELLGWGWKRKAIHIDQVAKTVLSVASRSRTRELFLSPEQFYLLSLYHTSCCVGNQQKLRWTQETGQVAK